MEKIYKFNDDTVDIDLLDKQYDMAKIKSTARKCSLEESIKRMTPKQRLKWKSKWLERITKGTRLMIKADMELCKELRKIK